MILGGVTWGDFIAADFRLRPAATLPQAGYRPPTMSIPSRGPLEGPLDVLDSADAAAAEEAIINPRLQQGNALIPDIALRKSSGW